MWQTIVVTCLHTSKLHIDEQIWWREKEEPVLLISFLFDGWELPEGFQGRNGDAPGPRGTVSQLCYMPFVVSSLIPLFAPQIFSFF